MLTFLLKVEGRPDEKLRVDDRPVVIGSEPGLSVTIADPAVAPRHAEIEVRTVGVVLKDLSTDTGTRVNGDLVSQVRLDVGDEIAIGATRLVLTMLETEPDSGPAPARAARPAKSAPRPRPEGAAPTRAEVTRERKRSFTIPVALLLLMVMGAGAALFLLTREPPETIDLADLDVDRPVAPEKVESDAEPEAGGPADGAAPETFEVPDRPVDAAKLVDRPEGPDPVAAAAAERERAERAHEDLLRRKREAERLRIAEEKYDRFVETLPDRISRYAFAGPIADAGKITETLPAGELRRDAIYLQSDLMRASAVFDRLKEVLGSGGKRTVTLASGLELVVLSVDDEGFTAKVGPAQTKKRWTELEPATVHDVLVRETKDAEDWMDLSAFAALYGLDAVETDLAEAFGADAELKPEIDGTIARRRGQEIPEGGWFIHEGEWITAEDKDYLDRGYVRHEGKWLTRDQWMEARGFVKHEGRWISPERYARVLAAQKEAESLASKYLPKGLIDKPGNGAFTEWPNGTTKAPVDFKTPHYRIKTNLGREVGQDLAYTMEILNSNLKAQFGIRAKGAKFTINLVATRDQYRGRWRAAGGSLGFCSTTEICTFYQPPMTTGVLMHEGTHQILRKFAPSAPRWLHEGVACYFECSRFVFNEKRRRVELEVGLLNSMRCQGCQAQIRSGTAAKTIDFIRGKGGDPYQQGWAFIYYLAKAKDGEYAPKMHTFFEQAHKKDVVERFQKIFKVKDMAVFEEEWKAWVLALDPSKGVRMDSAHR